jgi:signal peptidase II
MIYPLIAAAVICLDQLTKYLVRANMQPGDRIPVIGDWMSIYYVQNTGTAFSMFSGNRFVTIFLTSVLIILCIVFIVTEAKAGERIVPVLFTFVAAGGISNMIDRLALGFVTDMISCGKFAVFNVADIGVTCGCILTMIALVVLYKDDKSGKGNSEA